MMALSSSCGTLVTSGCLVLAFLSAWCHGTLFTFTRPESNLYCIMMDTDFKLLVISENSKGGNVSAVLNSSARTITTTGSCARSATINLAFSGDAIWSNVFTTTSSGEVILDRVFQFFPNRLFKDEDLPSEVVTFNDPGKTYLSQNNESFLCLRSETDEYLLTTKPRPDFKFRVIVTIDRIQVQAFNIKNNVFSPAVNCQDLTTPTSPTTTNTTTTPKPTTNPTPSTPTTPKPTDSTTPANEAPLNVYRVNQTGSNASCIILASRLRFSIPYEAKSEAGQVVKRLAKPFIPANATYTGNCSVSESEQSLVIHFLSGWSYQVLFTKAKKGLLFNVLPGSADEAGQRDLDYGISKMALTYVFDETHFPSYDPARNNGTQTVSSETDLPHKPSGSDFYDCIQETELKLSGGVKTMAKDFKFKAFNTDADGGFDGKAAECAADEGTNYLLPILLGTIICGIILIVLIVFGIVRYRRHRSYDRV